MSTVTWVIIAAALAVAAEFFARKKPWKDPKWKETAHYNPMTGKAEQ